MSLLSHFKIKTKLIFGFNIMIIFIISVGVIGYLKFSKINYNLNSIFDDTMPGSMLLLEADRDLYQSLVCERSMLFAKPQSQDFNNFLKEYELNIEQAEKRFKKFSSLATDNKEKTLIDNFDDLWKDWRLSSGKVISLCKDTSEESHRIAMNMSLTQTIFKFDSMRNIIDNLVDISYDQSEIANKSASEAYNSGKFLILFTVITGVFLGLLFSIIISSDILSSVTSAISSLKDIAEGKGDLTKRMEINTNDEVGTLALWFNKFINRLQSDMTELSKNAKNLKVSSYSLTDLASQMSTGSADMTSHANNVATSTEQMSSNLTAVASTTEQMTTGSTTVATAAEQMTATINEIAKSAEITRSSSISAVDQAHKASNKMETLGNNAKSIGKITETIQDISDQINLLSLNATIEAASAGSAGRGFTVVATEIKELSKRTAKANQDIAEQITGIQTTTVEAASEIDIIVKQMDDINNIVSQIATAAEQQSAATKEIASNISQVSQGMQEINLKVNQSSSVSQVISKDISDVSVSANSIYSGSNQLNLSAETLKQMATDLENIVGRFKI